MNCSKECEAAEEMDAKYVPDTTGWIFSHDPYACHYNMGVMCAKRDKCKSCGWNPQMEKYRKFHIRRLIKMGVLFNETN